MTELAAIRAALGLLHLPSSVRFVRTAPLPDGMQTLLKIAAEDEPTEIELAALMERPRPVIREAAAFYIEQVLLAPDSDHYRVLGLTPDASVQELRRNMALLLSWLHPDKNPTGERAVFAARVTGAWDTLRSPERRAAYDATLRRSDPHRRRSAPTHPQLPTALGSPRNGARQGAMSPGQSALRPAQQSLARHAAGLSRDEQQNLLQRGWAVLVRVLRGG
jgi:hypothetical protein